MPPAQSIEQNPARRGAKILRRRLPIILAALVLAPAATVAYSLNKPNRYTASAALLFRDPGFDQSILGSPLFAPSLDPARDAATNLKLVSLSVVADRAAHRLDHGVTSSDITNEISISSEGQSNVVSISVTDGSPVRAAQIANTFGQEFINFRRNADRSKVNQARSLSVKELAGLPKSAAQGIRGRLLRQRIDQLETVAALQTGNAELVQPATIPTSRSYPRPARDGALAAALGLLLGVGIAFLMERLDRRLHDPKEAEELVNRPILGAIPRSRALSRGRVGQNPLPPGEAEAFRMLRANLRYFNVDRELRSVVVTSAAPGDGKSTVAANLAFAATEAGVRTLLLEADLRHPTLARLLGLSAAPGLTNALARGTTLDRVVQMAPVPGRAEHQLSGQDLSVVVSGPIPPNPSDLMESDRLRQLIRDAESQYDFVVIDTPPTSVVSDAIPLVTHTSGVIVVARLRKTTRDGLARLRTQLELLDAPALGVVINSLGRDRDAYGYTYAYGYYGKQAEPSTNGHLSYEESEEVPVPARGDRSPPEDNRPPASSDAPEAGVMGSTSHPHADPDAAPGRGGLARRIRRGPR